MKLETKITWLVLWLTVYSIATTLTRHNHSHRDN